MQHVQYVVCGMQYVLLYVQQRNKLKTGNPNPEPRARAGAPTPNTEHPENPPPKKTEFLLLFLFFCDVLARIWRSRWEHDEWLRFVADQWYRF